MLNNPLIALNNPLIYPVLHWFSLLWQQLRPAKDANTRLFIYLLECLKAQHIFSCILRPSYEK